MKNDEINTYKIDKFDTQKFQDTFVEWFSQFKENVIDKEFENEPEKWEGNEVSHFDFKERVTENTITFFGGVRLQFTT